MTQNLDSVEMRNFIVRFGERKKKKDGGRDKRAVNSGFTTIRSFWPIVTRERVHPRYRMYVRVWADLCFSAPIRLEVSNERQWKRKERGWW